MGKIIQSVCDKACCNRGGDPKKQQIVFDVTKDGKKKVVLRKHIRTLDRYGMGAMARIERKKLKLKVLLEITDLKKPYINENNRSRKGTFTYSWDEETKLLDLQQIIQQINDQGLVWYNYYEDVGSGRKYKGTWTRPEINSKPKLDEPSPTYRKGGPKGGQQNRRKPQKDYIPNSQRETEREILDDEDMTKSDRRLHNIQIIERVMDLSEWTGIGTIKFPSGDIYYGQVQNGKQDGLGRMMYKYGNIYHGEWKDGLYHGKGVLWDEEGSLYDGDFVEGKKQGNGMYIFDKGRKFIGGFSNQRMQGEGVMTWPDGKHYKGVFGKNLPHGEGKMTWPDQSEYTGQFNFGVRQGMGEMVYSNGQSYKGKWFEDKPTGKGSLNTCQGKGIKIEGNWLNGELETPEVPLIAEDITEVIGNTPLVKLKNTEDFYAQVVFKLESQEPCNSVKDRIAKSMIEDAEKAKKIKPGDTIVEPTSGNTGIALAMVAAAKGYKLVVCMPETMSMERRVMIKAYGAELVITPGAKGMKGAIAVAEKIAKKRKAIILQQFNNPSNPKVHRETTGPEIWKHTHGKVDILVSGVGTGGTLTGCSQYLKAMNPDLVTVAVEPQESSVLQGYPHRSHKIQGIGAGFVPDVLDKQLIDEFKVCSSDNAMQTARDIAIDQGLLVGISAGAAIKVALDLAQDKKNEDKMIVVIIPSFGERYLSTDLYRKLREECEDLKIRIPK